jgi:dihydroorotate dehydrogenase (NAD+) catalytic subunit
LGEDRQVELGVELSGIRLKNPVLVCSGTFANGREYSEWMDLRGLGGLITKSVTLKPCAGNTPPRLWEVPYGLLNSIGLENRGLEAFLEEDLPWLHGKGLPLWVNVAGFTEDEYMEVAREISASSMAAALELNISCPNVKEGGIHFASSPVKAARLVSRIREETAIPLYVKLSPRTGDMKEMARMMEKAGADGLSLINTVPAMALDVETAKPRLGNLTGGLSGPAIHPVAVMAVWEACGEVDIPVIGMGGIWSWGDAAELLMAGADAVAVGTLNFAKPGAPLEILEGLRDFMVRKGMHSVEELVGKARYGGFS